MERPQSRIVQHQEVESTREVTGWEAEQLMRKYGHEPQHFSTHQQPQQSEQSGLSFEEMVAKHESKLKEELDEH